MFDLLDGGVLLALGEVAGSDFADEALEGGPFDDFEGVDNISSGFGHLISLGVADQGVEEYLLKGDLAGEPDGHHDHASDPEEEDVVSSFEELIWEKGLEIEVFSIWPLEGREGEET